MFPVVKAPGLFMAWKARTQESESVRGFDHIFFFFFFFFFCLAQETVCFLILLPNLEILKHAQELD